MSGARYFLFGTLRHPALLRAVLGTEPHARPATLPDHAVRRVAGQSFPILVPEPGALAEGLVVDTDAAGAARLDLYEGGFDYHPRVIEVQTDTGPVPARVFQADTSALRPDGPWSLADWAARWAPATIAAVPEVMALARAHPPEAQQARYAMALARADSALRARAQPAPATLRRHPGPDDVQVQRHRHPYAWFFGVEETDLRFRRFDGTLSAPVRRAGFVMADAVTVLPYDPATDRVMLIEQFRFGPWLRGDPNPWSLEPVAGRIDPGESPEDAARRETAEETGLRLAALERVSRCYPSPGAVTEYLTLYLGLATLAPSDEGIGGLDTEAEDIRAHVIGFDRLLALLDSGEIDNAPLQISALWLARHRDRLRAAARG